MRPKSTAAASTSPFALRASGSSDRAIGGNRRILPQQLPIADNRGSEGPESRKPEASCCAAKCCFAERDGSRKPTDGSRRDLAAISLRSRCDRVANPLRSKSQITRSPDHPIPMTSVLGIDAGGSKTVAVLADGSERILATVRGGGANLRTHGELQVEKVLHGLVEAAGIKGEAIPEAVALGIAGADRPEDHAVLRAILNRIGFRRGVVVTNDAQIAFVAGSRERVGLALVCGTGSIAWGRNRSGEIARAGGWGWHVGDEGSGFWIGERAIRQVLRAVDGRGPATSLEKALIEHFEIQRPEQILHAIYDRDYPRPLVARFAAQVERAALDGDAVAQRILLDAADELALATRSVRDRLRLEEGAYDVVLSGGTFAAVPTLVEEVTRRVKTPRAAVFPLREEPALGAVRLALEELRR
jgi:N-acetylglucosamine kinase-like BadF-type ATPase